MLYRHAVDNSCYKGWGKGCRHSAPRAGRNGRRRPPPPAKRKRGRRPASEAEAEFRCSVCRPTLRFAVTHRPPLPPPHPLLHPTRATLSPPPRPLSTRSCVAIWSRDPGNLRVQSLSVHTAPPHTHAVQHTAPSPPPLPTTLHTTTLYAPALLIFSPERSLAPLHPHPTSPPRPLTAPSIPAHPCIVPVPAA